MVCTTHLITEFIVATPVLGTFSFAIIVQHSSRGSDLNIVLKSGRNELIDFRIPGHIRKKCFFPGISQVDSGVTRRDEG
uniref:Uncharacterized protein n=1 Tax=Physcomitrium patens TaxID=3218 RepID=A0A2K1INH9_PHYPA|nr:hypothetical protein PHYPA_027155 [Physcomitrium patens]